MNIEDVKQALEVRLAKINAVAKAQNSLLHDAILGKHAKGVVDAIAGTGGEIEFIEGLLKNL